MSNYPFSPQAYNSLPAQQGDFSSAVYSQGQNSAEDGRNLTPTPTETAYLPISQAAHPTVRAANVWQMALSELALQMPSATYETWVRDTSVIAYEDGEFIVGTPNPYARDWLANRLHTSIKRILSKILQRSVQVTFRVRPHISIEEDGAALSPLYHTVEAEEMVEHRSVDERPSLYPQPEPSRRPQWETDAEEASVVQKTSATQAATPVPAWNNRGRTAPETKGDSSNRGQGTGRFEVHSTPLNPRYTFESFVVGSHNRLAHAAALSVADHPGQRFNPLFVYGGVGLGKTHLLHAIGNQMLSHGLQVLYCSSEQFTNDLISAIRGQSTEEFRNKYRQVDLLLIDDIQFIGGKESTQEEFFHTFNHLHAAGRQVVISSDRPPKEIATLEARLRSRFEGGLQADISQPDLETRVAILQTKAALMKTTVPMEVLMVIAERVESNIRELEGALNRLIVQAPLYENGLTRKVAEEILNNLMPQRRPREASSVVEIVAEHFHLTLEDMTGRTRTKEVAYARQVAMYMLREENALSLPVIGHLLGGRDHSTVRYGVEKVALDMEEDEELRRHILTLREKVYAPPASR
ncbi:MAG: chromosomal replication initiator protein DnaA [Caldilineaceae bacterium]|nr:chromosomal replication initiator protein DnaA [Caldilineaceae bacterium]